MTGSCHLTAWQNDIHITPSDYTLPSPAAPSLPSVCIEVLDVTGNAQALPPVSFPRASHILPSDCNEGPFRVL